MYGAGAAAAAAAAIAQAVKASGAIIQMEEDDFQKLLSRAEKPLIVYAKGGFGKKKHNYITSYKGLFFYCKSKTAINLPSGSETVVAKKIWIPG